MRGRPSHAKRGADRPRTNRGLFSELELAKYKGTVGYKIIAADLVLLAGALRRAWPKIQGSTAIRTADLDDANALADALITAVGVREQSPLTVATATRMRTRAFALVLRYYDEVRRAIAYIRAKEGDAEQLAPSLYSGRGNGNHKKKDGPESVSAAGGGEGGGGGRERGGQPVHGVTPSTDRRGPRVVTQNGKAAAVLPAPEELDRLTAQARFVAAVQAGLADQEAGRVVDREEVGRRLDARFGARSRNR